MLRFPDVRLGGGPVDVVGEDSVRPAKRESPSHRNCHLCSRFDPGRRLVVASAPELTIGFSRPSSLRSTAVIESKGNPVLLTPAPSATPPQAPAGRTRER